MRAEYTHPWTGFEQPPSGKLLRQFVSLEGPMGLAYERSLGFYKAPHVHDRTMWVLPRGSCRMTISTEDLSLELDQRNVTQIPAGLLHDDKAVSTVYDTVALYPADGLLEELGQRPESPETWQRPRTVWLDELVNRYFAIRLFDPSFPQADREALEREIVRAALGASTARPPAESHELERLMGYIETHLFQAIDVQHLARWAGMSATTLNRRFRAVYKTSPYAYIRARRLDEAEALLAVGQHQVQEVALLVGYEDTASFSKAYRKHFGRAPTDRR